MRILIKRLLASIADFYLIYYIFLIAEHFYSGDHLVIFSAMAGVYAGIMVGYKSTLGGMLVGLRVSSMGKSEEAGFLRVVFRIILLALLLFAAKTAHAIAPVLVIPVFAINALPIFFTEKRLMIHDAISGSFLVIDFKKLLTKRTRQVALVLVVVILVAGYFFKHEIVSKREICHNLYTKKQFQQVVDNCAAVTKRAPNSNLNIWLGYSYLELKNYDEAINNFTAAYSRGQKSASYLLVSTYISKQDLSKALEISEKETNDPAMLFLTSQAYSLNGDLVKANGYAQMMSDNMKNIKGPDPIRDYVLSSRSAYLKNLQMLSNKAAQ